MDDSNDAPFSAIYDAVGIRVDAGVFAPALEIVVLLWFHHHDQGKNGVIVQSPNDYFQFF